MYFEKNTVRSYIIEDDRRVDIFSFTQDYSKGSKAGRALFHGTVDVFTLGLWEIIGTPTEAVLDGKKMAFEVHYDTNDRIAKVVSLGKTKKPATASTHITASGEKSIASKSLPTRTGLQPLTPAAQGALIDTSYHQNWAVIVGISKY